MRDGVAEGAVQGRVDGKAVEVARRPLRRGARRWAASLGVAVLAAVPVEAHAQRAEGEGGAGPFTEADRAAVLAVDRAYVDGWLADDREGVLDLFEEDALLLPDGTEPVRGRRAMEAFWWPPGSGVTIERYESEVDEILGEGSLALVRGTGELTFSWTDGEGELRRRSSRSRHLTVLRRQPDGRWLISRRMWDGLPVEDG